MTLLKLDSGDYINTDFVTYIGHREWTLRAFPERTETVTLLNSEDDGWTSITPADRDRIVEAMGGDITENKSIVMKLDHNLATDITKVVGRGFLKNKGGASDERHK